MSQDERFAEGSDYPLPNSRPPEKLPERIDLTAEPKMRSSQQSDRETAADSLQDDATAGTEPGDSELSAEEQLSDEQLYAELKARNQPSEHERDGGLDFLPAVIMAALSAVGLMASVALVLATLTHLRDPDAALGCDLNSWISCGASLDSWQSYLVGIPNALLGTIAFTALLTISVLLISRVQLPRWVWVALVVASTSAVLLTYWFVWQSAFVFKTLCPWCTVVWVVSIALFVLIVGRAARAQIPGLGWLGRPMVREWWAFLAIMYILAVIIVVTGLGTRLFS